MAVTPNLALNKPDRDDFVSVTTALNENFDLIDAHATAATAHIGTLVPGVLARGGFSALRRALRDATRSVAVQVITDSTGDGLTDWPYLLGQSLATLYPAWTVQRLNWDDTPQDFSAPTVIQTGTDGVRYLDGGSAVQVARRLEASQSTHVSGVLDIRVKVRLAAYDVAQVLVAKSGTAGQRGWIFQQTTTGNGRPSFVYSVDGTAQVTHACNNTATVAADGADVWMRVVFTPNDGAGNNTAAFYTSTDGITYTQIGTTQTLAGTVTLFDNSATGYALGGNVATIAGERIYEVQIRDGLAGPNVVPALPDLWTPINTGSNSMVGAPILTIVNAADPGADIAYWDDATRKRLATPRYGQVVSLLSLSHNEGVTFGKGWRSYYKTWVDSVHGQLDVPAVILTQNPQKGAAVNKEWHAERQRDLLVLAARYALPLVDTYKAFTDVSTWETTLMGDDVHPNAAGGQVTASQIAALIQGS